MVHLASCLQDFRKDPSLTDSWPEREPPICIKQHNNYVLNRYPVHVYSCTLKHNGIATPLIHDLWYVFAYNSSQPKIHKQSLNHISIPNKISQDGMQSPTVQDILPDLIDQLYPRLTGRWDLYIHRLCSQVAGLVEKVMQYTY